MEVLTPRALNRALLARQSLLERGDESVVGLVERLVGLQAQAPLAPYVGLWSRLRDFVPGDLATALEDRRLVRATLQRGTVHLVTAEDALGLRPLVEPAIERGFQAGFTRRLAPEEAGRAVDLGRALLEAGPRTRVELREEFGREFPELDADAMAYAVSYLLPTVQPTPRGLWGRRDAARLTLLPAWLGRPLAAASIDDVVRRYLGAFGPASVADVQTWSGLTRLGEVLERLRPELRVFASDDGRELFDLPDAPRPDADLPVPPRFLPEYDNVLFSHADRRRILDPGVRVPLPPGYGARAGTVLVDGRFRGTWRLDGDTLRVRPLKVWPGETGPLAEEAAPLAAFLGVSAVDLAPA